MRFTVGRPSPISHAFEDINGNLVDPGNATVTVTRVGATSPVASGAATGVAGVYTYQLQSQLQGVYNVLWTGGIAYADTETVEFVGADLFSIQAFRKTHEQLADTTKYPGETIRAVRDLVAQEFETITGHSFVPRTVRVPWLVGDMLPRLDVASVKLWDASNAVVDPGTIETVGPWALLPDVAVDAILSAEIDYGFRQPPEDIKSAAMLRARSLLFDVSNGIPDRATSFQPGTGGTYILSTAGRRGATTGIPDVDAVLARYTYSIEDGIGGFW